MEDDFEIDLPVNKVEKPPLSSQVVFRNLLIVVGALLVGFFLVELIWSLVAPAPVPSAEQDQAAGRFNLRAPAPYIMFRPTPNANVPGQQFQRSDATRPGRIVTDSFGFRNNHEITIPKPADEVRVFLLGGSTVFNGYTNNSTISEELEIRLAALSPGKRVRVINCGIISAVSDQELALLTQQIAQLQPDLVIVLDGFNDIWTRAFYEPRAGYPFNWVTYEESKQTDSGLQRAINELPTWRFLLGRSHIFTHFAPSWRLENQLSKAVQQPEKKSLEAPSVPLVVSHFLLNWTKMHRIASAFGSKSLFLLQPCRNDTREKPPLNEFYTLAEEGITTMQSHGMHAFSLANLMDKHQYLYWDPVHTYDDAHGIFAERIAAIITDHHLLGTPPAE